jgi:pimeloyl-ACP methyl ester carboxylesterase
MKNNDNSVAGERFIERNGRTICYKTFGAPTNPCIILIMGLGGQLINWPTEITQGLADKGFYVITFDNRDAGLSSYYDDLKTPEIMEAMLAKKMGMKVSLPYTLEEMAADVLVLMDGLDIQKAHMVGVSMGGMISQLLALHFPERVLSLTCIASTSSDPDLPPATPEVFALFFTGIGVKEDIESAVNHRMQIHKVYNHPDDVNEDAVRKHFVMSYQRAYHPEGFKRQLLAIIFAKPRVEALKQLKIPTLIIHGDYDPAFPVEHGKQLAELIPNSHLEIIEKMGHGFPESAYEKLVGLIARHCKQ